MHEIRNPLATISLALEHFTTLEALPQTSRRRAQLASNELARLSQLIEDILLYAKPLLVRDPRRLAAIFDELADNPLLQAAQLHIDRASIHALPGLPLDAQRIKQVLINLIKNALEANQDDPRGVSIRADQEGSQDVRLVIENGGEEIDSEGLNRIFEPFYTSKPSGTGLGLSIVRRIIEAHGGSIRELGCRDRHPGGSAPAAGGRRIAGLRQLTDRCPACPAGLRWRP